MKTLLYIIFISILFLFSCDLHINRTEDVLNDTHHDIGEEDIEDTHEEDSENLENQDMTPISVLTIFDDEFSPLMASETVYNNRASVNVSYGRTDNPLHVYSGSHAYEIDFSTVDTDGTENKRGRITFPFASGAEDLSQYNALSFQIKAEDASKAFQSIEVKTTDENYYYYWDSSGSSHPKIIQLPDDTNFHQLIIPLYGNLENTVSITFFADSDHAGESGIFYIDNMQFEEYAEHHLPAPSAFDLSTSRIIVSGTTTASSSSLFSKLRRNYYFDDDESSTGSYNKRWVGKFVQLPGMNIVSTDNAVIKDANIENSILSITGVSPGVAVLNINIGSTTKSEMLAYSLSKDLDLSRYYVINPNGRSDFNGMWHNISMDLSETQLNDSTGAFGNAFVLTNAAYGSQSRFYMSSPMNMSGKNIEIRAGTGGGSGSQSGFLLYLIDSNGNNSAFLYIGSLVGWEYEIDADYSSTLYTLSHSDFTNRVRAGVVGFENFGSFDISKVECIAFAFYNAANSRIVVSELYIE